MNKMIKGSLAGATGIAVLMGGFGTYALWSDSADLPASSVSSGVLTISEVTPSDVVWADENGGEWDEGELLVPGDVVSRTQTFDITGTGANLSGTITFAEEALTGDFSENLSVDVDVTSNDTDGIVVPNAVTADPNDFMFENPFGADTLTTVVTYTFDGAEDTGATGDTDQNKTATLPASTFTIAQD